jgi:hypothetical protein
MDSDAGSSEASSTDDAMIWKLSLSLATAFPSRMALTVAVYLPSERSLTGIFADFFSVDAL